MSVVLFLPPSSPLPLFPSLPLFCHSFLLLPHVCRCTDLETDAAESVKLSCWPAALMEIIWRDRLRLRQRLKRDMTMYVMTATHQTSLAPFISLIIIRSSISRDFIPHMFFSLLLLPSFS